MTTITRSYTGATNAESVSRERTGGSRRGSPSRYEATNAAHLVFGSHMPLDAGIHWTWRNPLNLIPAFVLLAILIGIVGVLV